jgi:transposase-like protein
MEIAKAAIRLRDEQGLSRERLAGQLGMSKATLNSWVELAKSTAPSTVAKKQPSPRILPVALEVEPAPEPTRPRSPSVRLPSGMLVVGLSIVDIAALERALS